MARTAVRGKWTKPAVECCWRMWPSNESWLSVLNWQPSTHGNSDAAAGAATAKFTGLAPAASATKAGSLRTRLVRAATLGPVTPGGGIFDERDEGWFDNDEGSGCTTGPEGTTEATEGRRGGTTTTAADGRRPRRDDVAEIGLNCLAEAIDCTKFKSVDEK